MNVANNFKRLFPFAAEIADLDGSSKDRGEVGFGTPPTWTCAPRPQPTSLQRATGWRPILASFGYSTLGNETPHRVRIVLEEQLIPEARFEAGTLDAGERWRQVVFDEPAVSFVYITGIPIPVAEENGNPFALRIITEGRADPSQAVIDWEWARFSLDLTQEFFLQWRCFAEQTLANGVPVFDVGCLAPGVGK